MLKGGEKMKKILGLSALALTLGLGGFGLTHAYAAQNGSPVNTNAPVSQASQASENNTKETAPEVKETTGAPENTTREAADKSLPGGGHQDQGQANHDFNGVE